MDDGIIKNPESIQRERDYMIHLHAQVLTTARFEIKKMVLKKAMAMGLKVQGEDVKTNQHFVNYVKIYGSTEEGQKHIFDCIIGQFDGNDWDKNLEQQIMKEQNIQYDQQVKRNIKGCILKIVNKQRCAINGQLQKHLPHGIKLRTKRYPEEINIDNKKMIRSKTRFSMECVYDSGSGGDLGEDTTDDGTGEDTDASCSGMQERMKKLERRIVILNQNLKKATKVSKDG